MPLAHILSIPVVTKAGRKLPFAFSLNNTNDFWSDSGGSGSQWQPAPNYGWYSVGPVGGYVTYDHDQGSSCPNTAAPAIQPCIGPNCGGGGGGGGGGTAWQYTGWTYVDQTGMTHPAAGTLCSSSSSATLAITPDGYGYVSMDVSPGAAAATVRLADGSEITVPEYQTASIVAPGSDPENSPPQGTLIDANGNEISSSAGGASWTGTLGETVLTISGSGTPASPKVYTYPGPNGPVSVTVNYSDHNIATDFACGPSEYGAANVPLPLSIVMPDGSQYIFSYEPTPNDAADTTGRLASIQLPTGATIQIAYPGPNDGMSCVASGAALDRMNITVPDGTWSYSATEIGQVTETAPLSNQTVYNFHFTEYDIGYPAERQVFSGSATGTPLETTWICYNGQSIPYRTVGSLTVGALTAEKTTIMPDGLEAVTDTDYTASD